VQPRRNSLGSTPPAHLAKPHSCDQPLTSFSLILLTRSCPLVLLTRSSAPLSQPPPPTEPQGGDPDSPNWCPAEVDSTLQANDAWFWQPPAVNPLNSLASLVASYHASLGHNSNWLLGLSPAPNGTLAPQHAALAGRLGGWLRACYDATPVAKGAMTPGARTVTITSSSPGARVNRVRLREDQTDGQLVREYQVTAAQVYLDCFMTHPHARSRDPHHTAVSAIDCHLIHQLLLLLLILPNTDSALQSQRNPIRVVSPLLL
jgi:hypothetical protein